MIRPYGSNNDSRSGWDMFFGNPETYRLAPLIDSELGRAKDTYTKCKISKNKIKFILFGVPLILSTEPIYLNSWYRAKIQKKNTESKNKEKKTEFHNTENRNQKYKKNTEFYS